MPVKMCIVVGIGGLACFWENASETFVSYKPIPPYTWDLLKHMIPFSFLKCQHGEF